MKRILSAVLCAVLLLSIVGCGTHTPADIPEASTRDNAQATEPANDTPSGEAEEEPAEEPTAEAAPTADRTGEVVTDYSAYTPSEGLPKAKYTRLQDERIENLEPGLYGQRIYPFAADEMIGHESGYAGDYTYSIGRYYGFVNGAGKIVCDPVYTGIHRLSSYNYTTGAYTALPIWVMERTFGRTQHNEGEYSWYDGDTWYAVASLDGSFASALEFREVYPLDNAFVGMRSKYDERPDFDVYDLDGYRIFGAAELQSILPANSDGFYMESGDGVIRFGCYVSDRQYNYALDGSGNVLFGPMRYLEPFSDGLACASEDGELYGFVDKQGSWVISPRFTRVSSFQNGLAVCYNGDDPVVIDKRGVERITEHSGWMTDYGDYFLCNIDNYNRYRVYDRNGAIVYDGADGNYLSHVQGSIYYESDNGSGSGLTLYDFAKGTRRSIHGANWMLETQTYEDFESMGPPAQYSYNGTPCLIACGYNEAEELTTYTFLDYDFNVLGERKAASCMAYIDQLTGETYLGVCERFGVNNSFWELLRADGSLLGKYANPFRIYAGWVQATDQQAAHLYDPNGNEVFCYPLLSVMGD